jgi:hypothetical protein
MGREAIDPAGYGGARRAPVAVVTEDGSEVLGGHSLDL